MIQKALAMAETKNHHTPTIRAHGLGIFASRFKILGLWCLVRAMVNRLKTLVLHFGPRHALVVRYEAITTIEQKSW